MSLLTILHIIVSIALITLILLQERSTGMGAFGGGGDGGGFYQKRRGMEKIIYVSTIVLMVLFAGLSLLNLVF